MKNVRSSVRLIAANAERETDVAKVFRDVIVERFDLREVVGRAFDEFIGFGPNFGTGLTAIMLEAGIPTTDRFPTRERGHLDGGILVVLLLLWFFLLVFVLVVIFALEVRRRPAINASAGGFVYFGILAGLVL